jgi:Putative zinc-finger
MPNFKARSKVPVRGWHCPPPERLAAYIDGQLTERQRHSVERHLAGCRYCCNSVAGVVADARRRAEQTPAWLRRKAEEQVASQKPKSWRWAWAVAPALATVLIVAVLTQSPTKNPGKTVRSATPGSSPTLTMPAPSVSAPSSTAPRPLTRGINTSREDLKLLAPVAGAALPPGRLLFYWTAVPNVASYRIRIMTVDGGLVWEQLSGKPHARAPVTLKLAPGKYFAWVTAYLNDGGEQQSAPVSFRVQTQH